MAKKQHPDPFFQQLNDLTDLDNISDEKINPFGKKFSELTIDQKDYVIANLDPHATVNKGRAAREGHKVKIARAKAKREKGLATVILLGKFNDKTMELMKAKAKELGYKYPASLINDAIEDFLGIERGSSLADSMKKSIK